jgi:hypothetical protein
MNVTELTSRLRRRLGNVDASQVGDDVLLEAINEAYNHILDRYPFTSTRTWFRFTTVAGTSTYGLPGNAGSVRHVWDTVMRRQLPPLLDTDVGRWGTITGRPQGYLRNGQAIVLLPTPTGAYEYGVQMTIGQVQLVEPDDEPIIDQSWHEGIVRRARYEHYDSVSDYMRARNALLSWNEWVASKSSNLEAELLVGSARVDTPVLARMAMFSRRVGFPSSFDANVWGLGPYGD